MKQKRLKVLLAFCARVLIPSSVGLYFLTRFTSWNKKRPPVLMLLYSTTERLAIIDYCRCCDRNQ